MVLIVLPWVLTVVALFAIMVLRTKNTHEAGDYDVDEEHEIIRVAVYANKAYWVHDNVLYHAETTLEPDFGTAKPLDTMTLTEAEMKSIFEVLDELESYDKE